MRIFLLALTCMTLFAANSIFCRSALIHFEQNPWSYTAWRGFSASLALIMLSYLHLKAKNINPERRFHESCLQKSWSQGSWSSALALFSYMACFSWAYIYLSAALGTLIFNATIQFTILGYGLANGSRLNRWQLGGLIIVLLGLGFLTLPKVDNAPNITGIILGIGVGISWGAYSILGRKVEDAILATTGNFLRCIPLFTLASLAAIFNNQTQELNHAALINDLCAGIICTGCGYVLWYRLIPTMSLVNGSVIQLTVPIITAILGVLFLQESITWHLIICAFFILGGIATIICYGQK